ncbi:MAG: chalcone isomerase family protein [Candidatus Eisenbacteria bacterium]|uniref:Chalcone isomerase family protein n=1 Tax=Eiseniibacteriota bacterium TaxID=2212470 RepID=A0A948W711_UNCEI|nr:chalcone isomerase family protein [Candidatus Eisenbacteria bacterium]MBU1950508.1 chalcone isomerase family protein [Candidatus Eisenbacteria bacterium]MBU2691181.1 chalcone isomerase family protein [Candidatus Eisenbacteria bacterium]
MRCGGNNAVTEFRGWDCSLQRRGPACLFLVIFSLAWRGPAYAAEISGYHFDNEMMVEGSSLMLRSLAIKEATFFKIDVYAIGLYFAGGTLTAESILAPGGTKVLMMKFLVDVTGKKLGDSWIRDLGASCESNCDSLLTAAGKIAGNLPDIKKGQTITYIVFPSRVQILVNGSSIGFLEGANASRAVLAAIFGKRASKRLQDNLLRPLPQ